MYGDSKDKYPQYNTDYALKLLVKLGADKEKLIVGVPFYGQSFTLSTSKSGQGFNSHADGPGEPGEVTNQPGMLAYNEICNRLRRPGWKLGKDPSGKSGPYATDATQWVGFDDVETISLKTKYVINAGFGGIAAWTVDLDDFSNRCCLEPFPLLRSINRAMGRLDSPPPKGNDCTRPSPPVTPTPPLMIATVDTGAAGIPQSSFEPTSSTWWTNPSTSKKPTQATTTSPWWTTTKRPSTSAAQVTTTISTTTKRSTTRRPPTTASYHEDETTIPVPVNVMPVAVGGSCEPGEHRPHPTKCTEYLVCSNTGLITQYCPGGLHWNDRDKNCDWPLNAKCTANNPSVTQEPLADRKPETTRKTTTQAPVTRKTTTQTPVTRKTTTTRRATTTQRTTRPTTQEFIDYTDPPTTTIRQRTTTRRVSTARPTYYETTTTYMTTTSKLPNKKPSMPCVNGEYYPHKNCKKYYICNNGKRTVSVCPDGTQFSQKLNSCDHEHNVKCVSKKKYLKLLQRQYKKSGFYTASLLRAGEGDPCDGWRFLSYPGDCDSYLECVHETLTVRECPPGLHFDSQSNMCNWPKDCKDDLSLETNEIDGDEDDNEIDEDSDEEPNEENNNETPQASHDEGSFKPSTTTTVRPSTSQRPMISSFETIQVADKVEPLNGPYKLVCYFTNWAWYRPGIGKYLPDHIDANLCTHIVYGFAVLNYDELTIKTHDSWADIDNKFYERVVEFKQKGVKVTLAIGGWNDSAGDKYSRLVRNPAARAKFIKHVVEFLEKYGFEGLDLDWEYPGCPQVDCKKGHPDEKESFSTFVREISEAFRPRGLLLSSAVSPSKTVIDAGYDVPTLSKYFDWIAVMCYDYHGQWDKKTGHVAPLYHHPDDEIDFFNSVCTIKIF